MMPVAAKGCQNPYPAYQNCSVGFPTIAIIYEMKNDALLQHNVGCWRLLIVWE